MVQTHTPVKRLQTRSLQLGVTWITCVVFLQVSLVQVGGAGLPTTIWFPFVLSPSSAISPSLSLLILGWEELICDWANLLMVDGRKRSVSRQIRTQPCCTCVNKHGAANRTFPCSHIHRNVCTIPAAQLPPPPASFSLYIWHAQLLRSAIIIPPETHILAPANTRLRALFDGISHSLVFGDPRRSLLLFVTTEASLECVQGVCVCVSMHGAFRCYPDVFSFFIVSDPGVS